MIQACIWSDVHKPSLRMYICKDKKRLDWQNINEDEDEDIKVGLKLINKKVIEFFFLEAFPEVFIVID